MTRRLGRVGLALAAGLAAVLLFTAPALAKRPPGGAIRILADHARMHRGRPANVTALPYGGGPVLHWNRTHLIFWQPSGSGLTFEPGYESLIETFLRNVAAASHSSTNVFGLTGQYTDSSGPAGYASIYWGAVDATDPLPPNGCAEPPSGPPGWNVCVTDGQLEREIEHVVMRDRLPTGPTDVYLLVTPNGLGDCATGSSCALGGDVGGYCGYHSNTAGGLLYAVIPYNAVPGHCQSDSPRPNGTADPTISTISHELSEVITDPLSTAWVDQNSGEEMGDLCLTNFGPNIDGSTGPTAWNEDINGGHYYLQEEWSNHNGGCEPRAKPDSVSFQVGAGSSGSLSILFRAWAVDPQGKMVSYRWSYGDGRGGAGARAVHRYGRAGHYRVVLHTTDSWGNTAYYAAIVTVGRAGVRPARPAKAG